MQVKTIVEVMAKDKAPGCFIGKKGKKYLAWKGGELRLSVNQLEALAFLRPTELQEFVDWACVDSRNDEVVNGKFQIVTIGNPVASLSEAR